MRPVPDLEQRFAEFLAEMSVRLTPDEILEVLDELGDYVERKAKVLHEQLTLDDPEAEAPS